MLGKKNQRVQLVKSVPGLEVSQWKDYYSAKEQAAWPEPVSVLSARHLRVQLAVGIGQSVTPENKKVIASPSSQTTSSSDSKNKIIRAQQDERKADWKQAARDLDPARLLTDYGFTHNPKKGRKESARGQVYKRGRRENSHVR